MNLQVPTREADIRASLQGLYLSGFYDVSDDPPESRDHYRCARMFAGSDRHARLYISAERRDDAERSPEANWIVSYGVFLDPAGDLVDDGDVGSDEMLRWLYRPDRKHPVLVSAQFEFEDGADRSLFPLPLDVPSLELPGFDAISGVSLVNTGDGDSADPLYTLILQMQGDSLLASVRTTVTAPLGDDLLVGCTERSVEILRMGVK